VFRWIDVALKTSRYLPLEDQLFIENRLLLLHME
jgi:hypothetical protein